MAPDAAEVRVVIDTGEGGFAQQLVQGSRAMSGKFAGATQRGATGAAGQMKKGAGMVAAGLKKSGVQFGLASMLKQSQIFTGFFGSLFQIIGGMIDVLLAPLMPILMPVLQWTAKQIPVVAAMAQAFLGPIVDWVTNFGKKWSESPGEAIKGLGTWQNLFNFAEGAAWLTGMGPAFTELRNVFEGGWWSDTARPNIQAWFDSVKEWWQNSWEKLDESAVNFFNNWIVGPINDLIQLIYDGIEALPGDQTGWVVPQFGEATSIRSREQAAMDAYQDQTRAGTIPFSVNVFTADENARIAIESAKAGTITQSVADLINSHTQ